MSRLCRLKSYKHIGEDGQWAYDEIIRLREKLKVAESVINQSAAVFHNYALHHAAKEQTPDNAFKVERNLGYSRMCDEALAKIREE